MKHFFSFLAFVCFFFCAASSRATTISGVVTLTSTGAVVPGVKVYIDDTGSIPIYHDSTVTNSAGAYSFTLPTHVGPGQAMLVRVDNISCTPWFQRYFFRYMGGNMQLDFRVCAGNYALGGQVNKGGSSAVLNTIGKAYLISKAYDPVIADTVLTAIDSFQIADFFGMFYRTYQTLPTGKLLVKVALSSVDANYATSVPTYYGDVLQWNSATELTSANLPMGNTVFNPINMVLGTNPGGPGFIGGSVLAGANKTTSPGDPLAQRVIILTKSDNTPVAYTYSNASGQFSFSNLPNGTYKLFGDVWGKKNPPLTVTLANGSNNVNNVLFKENSRNFTGQIGGLSVNGINPLLAGISAYPNPASDYVEISGLTAIGGAKTATLCAVNGAVISRHEVSAGQSLRIPTATLTAGVYFLKVQTAEGAVQLKVIK